MGEITQEDAAQGPMLFARVLNGKGGGRTIGWDAAQEWQPEAPGEVLWVHLCRNRPGVEEWLENKLGIPEPTAELLVSDQTRPRAFREGETLVATLRGINFNPGAEPEDMVSMQLWSDGKRLLTLRRETIQAPRRVLADIDAGEGPLDAGAVVTDLVEHLVTHMNAAIVEMNSEIDRLEAKDPEAERRSAMLSEIAEIRRNALMLQRHMGPLHVALESISRDAPDWFEHHDRREIAETIALLRRFLDDIDISKESAVVLMDGLNARAAAAAARTNFLLSIVASIFLPLTLFTGLLGSNVAGIPYAEEPWAFWAIVGMSIAIIAGQMALFRYLRWL